MLFWEVRDETGKIVGTEFCPGNAAELEMVLTEMNPDKTAVGVFGFLYEVSHDGTPILCGFPTTRF